MTNTTNPMETVESVTKLNKGTSRDQWGNFGFWGFKTPNGKVRARVYDNGMFEVKTFDPTKLPSYRKTMNWDDAQLLGSAFLTVSDADKGPNSTEMVAEINAIVDGYNDTLAKWHDKHVINTNPINNGNEEGFIVTTVTVEYDEQAVPKVTLIGQRGYYRDKLDAEDAREVRTNDYREQLRDLIATEKKNIEEALLYIDTVNLAVDTGVALPEPRAYQNKGSIHNTTARKMWELSSKLVTDKVESPTA